jgi:hypothetical protein
MRFKFFCLSSWVFRDLISSCASAFATCNLGSLAEATLSLDLWLVLAGVSLDVEALAVEETCAFTVVSAIEVEKAHLKEVKGRQTGGCKDLPDNSDEEGGYVTLGACNLHFLD